MTVVLNTAQAAVGTQYRGSYPLGAQVPVIHTSDGTAYVNILDLHLQAGGCCNREFPPDNKEAERGPSPR